MSASCHDLAGKRLSPDAAPPAAAAAAGRDDAFPLSTHSAPSSPACTIRQRKSGRQCRGRRGEGDRRRGKSGGALDGGDIPLRSFSAKNILRTVLKNERGENKMSRNVRQQ